MAINNNGQPLNEESFQEITRRLADLASQFYLRGWLLGTSGNLSSVIRFEPLRVAITASGLHKGRLTSDGFLEIDDSANVLIGVGKPSAESLIHLAVIRATGCRAVIHTHSVQSTVLSMRHADIGRIEISGLEMLKGLENVPSHEHREIIPIIRNSQDMALISRNVSKMLEENPSIHGFLLSGHGLYTWGSSIEAAGRHVEVMEFLLDVLLRYETIDPRQDKFKIEKFMVE
ncbi:methylthioribulose 1-phosphate dehydratase [Thermoplasmatales archaeon AK]|nr:methylthioribulose 1-phosphate dehydratase [Thermoplasmatales archaeon AK]